MNRGLVLDSGAFIAMEREDPYTTALLQTVKKTGEPITTSAGVIGQVWRGGPRQAPIARVLKWPNLSVESLTHMDGITIGKMLAISTTKDIIDAHIALLARQRDCPVVTSDPQDLHSLDPFLKLWMV